jgi:hypothetical protein
MTPPAGTGTVVVEVVDALELVELDEDELDDEDVLEALVVLLQAVTVRARAARASPSSPSVRRRPVVMADQPLCRFRRKVRRSSASPPCTAARPAPAAGDHQFARRHHPRSTISLIGRLTP